MWASISLEQTHRPPHKNRLHSCTAHSRPQPSSEHPRLAPPLPHQQDVFVFSNPWGGDGADGDLNAPSARWTHWWPTIKAAKTHQEVIKLFGRLRNTGKNKLRHILSFVKYLVSAACGIHDKYVLLQYFGHFLWGKRHYNARPLNHSYSSCICWFFPCLGLGVMWHGVE